MMSVLKGDFVLINFMIYFKTIQNLVENSTVQLYQLYLNVYTFYGKK